MSGGVPGESKRPVPLLNPANGLTAVRIAVVPLFIALVVVSEMTSPGWRIAACVAFCVASLTDYIDGWVARSWDMVTSFGKVADPIADKALTGTALVLLSAYGRVPWWMTTVILVREFAVTGLRFLVIRRAVIAASSGGKLKTALQIAAIAWCLVPFPGGVATVGWWLMLLAVVVTVATGLDYLARAVRLPAVAPAAGAAGSAVPPDPVPPDVVSGEAV